MKILVIDDDKMICFALKTIIESESDMEVIDIGHNYDDAISKYEELKPDICLFDIRIGEKTGIDALKDIKISHPDAKIIFLTTFLDQEYIRDSIKYGSSGYILKDDFENICPAIRAANAGQSVFGNKVFDSISILDNQANDKAKDSPDRDKKYSLIKLLSEREIDILELIADGLSNKEIANRLYLSEGTIRNYISSILVKLDLRDRTQLAIYYLKN
ncbi:LuxR family transcriptional regulator [Peptostreptococcus sp. MV1]|uniref:response regulator n=1 Tax=Peptostreptococcus sp. MV1 TaxID=1219626 RepID=UPI00050EDA21|nr:response regulator transcription factor [Peptostreptococcus sp. MV1]KGF13256.1 LuxR family transcriptional regulator [Peptostreptococcus sp. MV1]